MIEVFNCPVISGQLNTSITFPSAWPFTDFSCMETTLPCFHSFIHGMNENKGVLDLVEFPSRLNTLRNFPYTGNLSNVIKLFEIHFGNWSIIWRNSHDCRLVLYIAQKRNGRVLLRYNIPNYFQSYLRSGASLLGVTPPNF